MIIQYRKWMRTDEELRTIQKVHLPSRVPERENGNNGEEKITTQIIQETFSEQKSMSFKSERN